MEELFEEYGSVLIALCGTLTMIGMAGGMLAEGGGFLEFLLQIGSMAC